MFLKPPPPPMLSVLLFSNLFSSSVASVLLVCFLCCLVGDSGICIFVSLISNVVLSCSVYIQVGIILHEYVDEKFRSSETGRESMSGQETSTPYTEVKGRLVHLNDQFSTK
jgi:hypothetical protein